MGGNSNATELNDPYDWLWKFASDLEAQWPRFTMDAILDIIPFSISMKYYNQLQENKKEKNREKRHEMAVLMQAMSHAFNGGEGAQEFLHSLVSEEDQASREQKDSNVTTTSDFMGAFEFGVSKATFRGENEE